MHRLRSAVVVLFATAAVCPAAVVTWGPATNIVAVTDVVSVGSTTAAANFGPIGTAATTVNGVTFNAHPIGQNVGATTFGNVTIRETRGPLNAFNDPSGAAPFTALPAAYQTLLGSFATSGVQESLEVTITGLTPGVQYAVQPFANYSTSLAANAQLQIVGGPLLDLNVSNANGGLGQYAVGTFTADGASQVFLFDGAGDYAGLGALPFLNAIQLRAVPEPTGLLAAGSLLAFGLRRRRD